MTLLRGVIGQVLRRARRERGRTLRDVCEQSRVSVQYLSEIERGRKEASSEVLAAICSALGWDLIDLLDAARTELARTELARTEPARTELIRTERARTEAVLTGRVPTAAETVPLPGGMAFPHAVPTSSAQVRLAA